MEEVVNSAIDYALNFQEINTNLVEITICLKYIFIILSIYCGISLGLKISQK